MRGAAGRRSGARSSALPRPGGPWADPTSGWLVSKRKPHGSRRESILNSALLRQNPRIRSLGEKNCNPPCKKRSRSVRTWSGQETLIFHNHPLHDGPPPVQWPVLPKQGQPPAKRPKFLGTSPIAHFSDQKSPLAPLPGVWHIYPIHLFSCPSMFYPNSLLSLYLLICLFTYLFTY